MGLLAHCTTQVAAHVLSWSLAEGRKLQLSIFAAAGGEGLKAADAARPPAIAELRRKTQAGLSRFRRGCRGVVKLELQLQSMCSPAV